MGSHVLYGTSCTVHLYAVFQPQKKKKKNAHTVCAPHLVRLSTAAAAAAAHQRVAAEMSAWESRAAGLIDTRQAQV